MSLPIGTNMFDTPYRSLSQSIREKEFLQVNYILLLDDVLLYLMLVIEFDLKQKKCCFEEWAVD